MNKLGWFITGAGVAVVGLAALGVASFVEAEKNVRYASDTTGDYELDMQIQPGRVPAGRSQLVLVRLTKNGAPVANTQIQLKSVRDSGTVTQTLTTDASGVVMVQVVSFKAQTIAFTAFYTTPGNSTVQVSATGTWCNCGLSSGPLPATPVVGHQGH